MVHETNDCNHVGRITAMVVEPPKKPSSHNSLNGSKNATTKGGNPRGERGKLEGGPREEKEQSRN